MYVVPECLCAGKSYTKGLAWGAGQVPTQPLRQPESLSVFLPFLLSHLLFCFWPTTLSWFSQNPLPTHSLPSVRSLRQVCTCYFVQLLYCIAEIQLLYCIAEIQLLYCIAEIQLLYCIAEIQLMYCIAEIQLMYCIAENPSIDSHLQGLRLHRCES